IVREEGETSSGPPEDWLKVVEKFAAAYAVSEVACDVEGGKEVGDVAGTRAPVRPCSASRHDAQATRIAREQLNRFHAVARQGWVVLPADLIGRECERAEARGSIGSQVGACVREQAGANSREAVPDRRLGVAETPAEGDAGAGASELEIEADV